MIWDITCHPMTHLQSLFLQGVPWLYPRPRLCACWPNCIVEPHVPFLPNLSQGRPSYPGCASSVNQPLLSYGAWTFSVSWFRSSILVLQTTCLDYCRVNTRWNVVYDASIFDQFVLEDLLQLQSPSNPYTDILESSKMGTWVCKVNRCLYPRILLKFTNNKIIFTKSWYMGANFPCLFACVVCTSH